MIKGSILYRGMHIAPGSKAHELFVAGKSHEELKRHLEQLEREEAERQTGVVKPVSQLTGGPR